MELVGGAQVAVPCPLSARNDSVVEKQRSYMTEEEAKSISGSGGVDLEAGVMGGQSALVRHGCPIDVDGGVLECGGQRWGR